MVFNLVNGFANTGERNVYYGFFEVTGALHLIWGDQPLVGFTLSNERVTILQEISNALNVQGSSVRNMQPDGPQATILLHPGSRSMSNRAMVFAYYSCRLMPFCDTNRVIDGIADARLAIGPIEGLLPP